MTQYTNEPAWSPDKKCLTSTVTRGDGWTLEGQMVMESASVSLIAHFGPSDDGARRSTLVVRNLSSTTEGRKEFLRIAQTFLAGGDPYDGGAR